VFSEVKQLHFVIHKLKCTDSFLVELSSSINIFSSEVIPMSVFFVEIV